jgi:hypothetical protein
MVRWNTLQNDYLSSAQSAITCPSVDTQDHAPDHVPFLNPSLFVLKPII